MRNPERGSRSPEKPEKNPLIEMRDKYKEQATELQNNIAENQEARLGIALRELMRRTEDNTELVNNLNSFLQALEHQASFGESEEPLAKSRVEDLIAYFSEKSEELRWDVGGGNRRGDRKPTWENKNRRT